MESTRSPAPGIPERALDLSFGFNNPKFSDRTLLLEIFANDDQHCSYPLRNLKRRGLAHTTMSPLLPVKTVHVSSLILAARSPYFSKLFSNGMQESEQKNVTLRIEAIEEDSFMDLLKYVYSNKLPTSFDALLDLLLTADQFVVDSCSTDCNRALKNMPMTFESASVYLGLHPSLQLSPSVQTLVDAAKQFLTLKFKNLDKCKEEILNLPLAGFQVVLSSDDLQVTSEFDVYSLMLTWAYKHFPVLEERQETLKTHLLHLIRFPFMTTTQLTEIIQTSNYIDPELASKIVISALCFKAETNSHRKLRLAANEGKATSRQFVKRAYTLRQVKVFEFELPHQHCVVYLDLTRDELKSITPPGSIWTETFHLGGVGLSLFASFGVPSQSNQLNFGLALDVVESSTCTVKYKFEVRRKPQEEFKRWFAGIHKFDVANNMENLRGEERASFIGDDSSFFINGILHVRAELTIINE